MFSQREVDSGLEEAFNGAIEILRVLSQQSAQAAHYFEILTTLANAVAEKRQRLSLQRPQCSRYVSKLFSLNKPTPRQSEDVEVQAGALQPDGTLSPVSNHANNVFLLAQGDRSASNPTPEVDSLFSGWEGLDLPLWDSFPFLTEPDRLQDKPDGYYRTASTT